MAQQNFVYRRKKRISRKGIHAKAKTSHSKGSKIYKKRYRGQGR